MQQYSWGNKVNKGYMDNEITNITERETVMN